MDPQEHGALLKEIETEDEHHARVQELHTLVFAADLTPEEEAYCGVLSNLIKRFEERCLDRDLKATAKQIAAKQGWPLDEALAYLTERGLVEYKASKQRIADAYARFMEATPGTPEYAAAVDALYWAVFGSSVPF